jgi:DNA-binding MarR family transcriptional regulator
MVRKAEAAGFVSSATDADDRRRVLVGLTDAGETVLTKIAEDHLAELRRLRPAIIALLRALG